MARTENAALACQGVNNVPRGKMDWELHDRLPLAIREQFDYGTLPLMPGPDYFANVPAIVPAQIIAQKIKLFAEETRKASTKEVYGEDHPQANETWKYL